ncbi:MULTISPECIES: IclR family transcriptional regulator [Cupriavidus]|uniref:IclR family transcriptional regulator n=1 Tax=Cupriavidus campinensis TaxID=151783 RepID=A0AAE9I305_9BURK|nr:MULTISPECIES: IclR family transcriptional regulator [Cupriavidus]TSP12809.1 IclR family transcriptional regulator [Cupriavidus campinensis]URF06768.1 IclR family transcriptional regulator [Cupriavidus campinensis]
MPKTAAPDDSLDNATELDNDDASGAAQALVTPVMRGLRLLRFIAEGGSTANLSEVGRRIDMNRVTVMRLLATLEHEGMVERLPQGGHTVGFSFLKLASRVLAANDLTTFARRVLAQLSSSLQLSAYLAVPDGGHVLYLLRDMPNTGLVSNIQVGSRVPAHLTTPGRMLIAHLSPEALRERLGDDPLPTVTGQSPATHARLAEILGADLERGCAWSFSAFEPGIDACAAPVMDATGDVIAAISVAGPQQRFEADGTLRERVEKEVKAAAKDLSALLGYRANGKR